MPAFLLEYVYFGRSQLLQASYRFTWSW